MLIYKYVKCHLFVLIFGTRFLHRLIVAFQCVRVRELREMRSLVLSLVTLFSIGFVSSRDQAPNWPSSYEVKGTLSIPFAEIEEPFSAWVDLDQSKSRIDYYNGMVKTFQRGDLKTYGTSVKVILRCISVLSLFNVRF